MLDLKLKRELGLTLPAVLTLEQRDLKDQVNIVKHSKILKKIQNFGDSN